MATASSAVPPTGYHTVTPYLVCRDAAKIIGFAKQVFGATESFRSEKPGGKVGHSEIKIGDSVIMVADATDEWKAMPTTLYVYVEDTDATYKRALAAGASSLRAPIDESYGDRSAGVQDANGNQWWIGTPLPKAT